MDDGKVPEIISSTDVASANSEDNEVESLKDELSGASDKSEAVLLPVDKTDYCSLAVKNVDNDERTNFC